MTDTRENSLFIPLSRARAATRAILWAVPALLLGTATIVIYSRLEFIPTAVSNRLVDYAVAVASLPLTLVAVFCALRMLTQLLAVAWPPPLGIEAGEHSLALLLGPFGIKVFPADELDIRYPFELSGDSDDGGFEQFLPEEEQMARLLPRITHPRAKLPINRTILRFVAGDEAQVARLLQPMVARWRERRSDRESSPSPGPLP